MRPRSKVQLIFWLLIAILLPTAIAPPFGLVSWPHDRQIVSAALIGILCAILWRAWLNRRLRLEQEASAERRYGELKRSLTTIGESLEISGSSALLLVLIAIVLDVLLVTAAVATRHVMVILGAVLFTGIALLATTQWLAALGKPILTLSRAGVQPAGFGLVPWSSIHGIELRELKSRGSSNFGHVLSFYVPDLGGRLGEAHALIRVLHAIFRTRKFRSVVTVRLRNTSELPHVIERLCRDLWKTATGRDHPWSIYFSEAEMQFAGQVARFKDRPGTAITLENAQRDMQDLHELQRGFERAQSAVGSRMAWTNIGITAAAALLLLMTASRFVSMLTNFVATDAWFLWSAAISAAAIFIGYALFIRLARTKLNGDLRGGRLWGLVGAMVVSLALVFPLTLGIVESIAGDIVARRYGKVETITVVATKTDSHRSKACDERLRGVGIGNAICLTRAQYDLLPAQVPVTLTVRRAVLGYHVDAHRIETSAPGQ
jgi:hypothetical protein